MINPKSDQENDKHKLPWDFDMQRDQLISVRRSDFIVIKLAIIVEGDPRVFFNSFYTKV